MSEESLPMLLDVENENENDHSPEDADQVSSPPPYLPTDFAHYRPQIEAYPDDYDVPQLKNADNCLYDHDQADYHPPLKADMQYPSPQFNVGFYGSDKPDDDEDYQDNYRSSNVGFESPTAFSEKKTRLAFVRKMYLTLLLQILFTGVIIIFFMTVTPIRRYCQWHIWPVITFASVVFVLLIVLAFCMEVRRRTPWNILVLFFFTICEGCFLGSVAVYVTTVDVVLAVAITAIVLVCLTLFAMQTKWDFTLTGSCLLVAAVVAVVFAILCLAVQNRLLDVGLASICALIFSLYIVLDTQLMLGGKHRYSLSPEEYIFAALNLYLDVVNLFILFLVVIGCVKL